MAAEAGLEISDFAAVISTDSNDSTIPAGTAVQVTRPRLLVLHDKDEESIVGRMAVTLGRAHRFAESIQDAMRSSDDAIIGLQSGLVKHGQLTRPADRLLVAAHCMESMDARNPDVVSFCDYEYIYSRKDLDNRWLARYLGVILGESDFHGMLMKKDRTAVFTLNMCDVRSVMQNVDVLLLGADAVELEVHFSTDPVTNLATPSVEDMGKKLSTLRQSCSLPVILSPRPSPRVDPQVTFDVLRKAIRWGCEYIEVDISLPLELRHRLTEEKGCSKIISRSSDWSGNFKWSSDGTRRLFCELAGHGDIVKMTAQVEDSDERYALELFRSEVQTTYAGVPFSGFCTGDANDLSSVLNTVFTPIAHPLTPVPGSESRPSAADVNFVWHKMGRCPARNIYAMGHGSTGEVARLLEQCVNELSLAHRVCRVEDRVLQTVEAAANDAHFGGVYLDPPAAVEHTPSCMAVTEAAAVIGRVNVMSSPSSDGRNAPVADNVEWTGIRATLTEEFLPSAFAGKSAVVLASCETEAAAAIYALFSLDFGPIYTIGFNTTGTLASGVRQCHGLDDLDKVEEPWVLVSALAARKSHLAGPVLERCADRPSHADGICAAKVFVNLTASPTPRTQARLRQSGWRSYGLADVKANTVSATLSMLIGQPVPARFVRLVGGREVGP